MKMDDVSWYIKAPTTCQEVKDFGLYNLTSDFNGDCTVDFNDLIIFVGDWLKCFDPAGGPECILPGF